MTSYAELNLCDFKACIFYNKSLMCNGDVNFLRLVWLLKEMYLCQLKRFEITPKEL